MTITEFLAASREEPLPLLDVRTPLEFAKGHFPGAWNAPILDDNERHRVGIRYKERGQEAAVALGHELVNPKRAERVERWIAGLKKSRLPLLTCWRGGLRSQTAQQWIQEAGQEVRRIEGGYKELRCALAEILEQPLQGYVLTGFTGSGKTAFLQSLKCRRAIDLEGFASHRGSAFGSVNLPPQPAQQSFENRLGLALWQAGEGPKLFENESRLIGRCVLPEAFFLSMRALPRVELVVPFAERVDFLLSEYVTVPMKSLGRERLEAELAASLLSIRPRLGGAAHHELEGKLRLAFARGDGHRDWIAGLLRLYYDPLYEHSRAQNQVEFGGDAEACRNWLKARGF